MIALAIHRLNNALCKLGFPFLADPPMPLGEKYKGIIEYPGFHTTTDFDIAAMYAAGRVNESFTDNDEEEVHFVTDYPVVVSLNMSGFTPQVDYDAAELVAGQLFDALTQMIEWKHLTDASTDDEILRAMDETSDMGAERDDAYTEDDALNYLSEHTFSHFDNPIGVIKDDPTAVQIVRKFMQTKTVDDSVLMDATKQYRYTEDIPEDRIVGVWFVTPVASEVAWYDKEDFDEEELDRKWPGFDIKDTDQVYSGSTPHGSLVYGTDAGDQYHGTTYKRLLSAAPALASVLPKPPSPPYVE
jgi:hypothetical protein